MRAINANVRFSDHAGPNRLHFLRQTVPFAGLLLCLTAACGDEESAAPAAAAAESDGDTAPETAPLLAYAPGDNACADDGVLRGRLYGAIEIGIDWQAEGMSCEGMARPHGEGARLRFAGTAGDAPIAIIISMPSLERGSAMQAVPSNVTVIEEGHGRFFSATDLETCWTDVGAQAGIDETDYRVEGVLYCISPLPEIGGDASITVDEIEFVGRLGWESG